MSERQYLFEYYFEGDAYGLTVVASSIEEAGRKVRRMSTAEYKGEVAAIIPIPTPNSLWQWLASKLYPVRPSENTEGRQ